MSVDREEEEEGGEEKDSEELKILFIFGLPSSTSSLLRFLNLCISGEERMGEGGVDEEGEEDGEVEGEEGERGDEGGVR